MLLADTVRPPVTDETISETVLEVDDDDDTAETMSLKD